MIALLLKIIETIGAVSSKVAWDKIKRGQVVAQVLRRLKLDPLSPDFQSVYVYALVEYGVDKPKPILEFFRNELIIKAFKDSYDRGDFDRLKDETVNLLEWHEVGRELALIQRDPQQEFTDFLRVFEQVVDRSRTPAQSRQERKIDKVGNTTGQMATDLAEIKVSLAELRQPNQIPSAKIAENLEQQLRKWFEALGYKREKHDERDDNYFEWIIDVPARRGFDRIVVRGFEGKVEAGDVVKLNEAVALYRADEGWIVANRRVSPAARQQGEGFNDKIFCYTFDELLDETADFTHYFKWLEAEVRQRGIDKMYVPLAGKKEEIIGGIELIKNESENLQAETSMKKISRNFASIYNDSNGWLEGYIKRWLDDPDKEHISILGEFGTGKTWFLLHFAWEQLQEYKKAKVEGRERPRVPLVIPLRDYAKAVSVESLFSEFFFRKHEIRLPGYSAFEQLNRMGKLLLLFDGFDEMADKVDRQKVINNFWELAKVVVPGSKAILTCRTEHFPTDKDSRDLLSAELKASTAALTGEPPQFEVIELLPLSKEQVEKVLAFRASPLTVKRILQDEELVELAQRPVMIEYIVEALPEIEEGKPVDLSRIYLYATQRKMKDNIREGRTFTSLADKLFFLCELSWEMISTEQMSLNYRMFPDKLRKLFSHAVQEEKDLDHWHYDMMGQTMLNRNAEGDYKPAHRSLLEFFVAYKFVAELGLLADDFSAVAKDQSNVDMVAPNREYSWSSYFKRQIDKDGKVELSAPLKDFSGEEPAKLVETFGQNPLAKAILDLMINMFTLNMVKVKARLLELILWTKNKNKSSTGFIGGNAATLLSIIDKEVFNNLDLSEVNLDGVSAENTKLIKVDLSNSSIRSANLWGAQLVECNLESADFSSSELSYSSLTQCNLESADFSSSDFSYSKLTHCNLDFANLTNVNFERAFLRDTNLRESNLTTIDLGIFQQVIRAYQFGSRFIYLIFSAEENFQGIDNILSNFKFSLQKGEIGLVYSDGKVLKTLTKIQTITSPQIEWSSSAILVLTIEGQIVIIDRKTGKQKAPNEKSLNVFLKWNKIDVKNAKGLNQKNAYLLKILGALNIPETNYDPSQDKSIQIVVDDKTVHNLTIFSEEELS